MEKPITMVINETRESLIKTINESNIPPFIMEMMLKDIYMEVNQLNIDISIREKEEYLQSLKEPIE